MVYFAVLSLLLLEIWIFIIILSVNHGYYEVWKQLEYIYDVSKPQHQACPGLSSGSGPGMQRCLVGRDRDAVGSHGDRFRSGLHYHWHRRRRMWRRCPQCKEWLHGRWAALRGSCSSSLPQRNNPARHARCSRVATGPCSTKTQQSCRVEREFFSCRDSSIFE